eukprot:7993612-Alexandrium_andersonii.AAC.1
MSHALLLATDAWHSYAWPVPKSGRFRGSLGHSLVKQFMRPLAPVDMTPRSGIQLDLHSPSGIQAVSDVLRECFAALSSGALPSN